MRLHAEEAEAGPWRRVDDELREILTRLLPDTRAVLLVDGRSGSGKSTFAERARLLLGGAVVHTDDLAWHHDAVAWDDLALTHVIEPWRRGEDVDYRPPGWVPKGREGSVRVPENVRALVLEGVGAGRATSSWVGPGPRRRSSGTAGWLRRSPSSRRTARGTGPTWWSMRARGMGRQTGWRTARRWPCDLERAKRAD